MADVNRIAEDIDVLVAKLQKARNLASDLEGGLDTQVAIRKTSVAVRDLMLEVRRGLPAVSAKVLVVRDNLFCSVGDIQAANTKARLEAQVAELTAKLAAL